MPYIPKSYWLEHGKTYKKEFKYNKKYKLQEQMLVEYLEGNIFCDFSSSLPMKILEFGCGFGRITNLLLEKSDLIEQYTAVDISPHQIQNAQEFLRANKKLASNIRFVVSDVNSYNSANDENCYDLVFSCEMLMHIPPSQIESVISKLICISRKHVINIDWYEREVPKNAAPHNFIHDYFKIYRTAEAVKRVHQTPIFRKGLFSKINVKQSIFHALIQKEENN